jgi:transposase
MEACATAHDWGRAIEELGHAVRLLPPSYVKPFVERHENDAADAEAITEAAARPTMRFVPLETAEQQARGMIFRTRDLLVRQRTQLINDVPPAGGTSGSEGGAVGRTAQWARPSRRGHLAEHGVVAPQGPTHVGQLAAAVEDEDPRLPEMVRDLARLHLEQIADHDRKIADLDNKLRVAAGEGETTTRLQTMPGVGPVTAMAIDAFAPPMESFRRGRDFAAWLGLVPLQRSTGGKAKLGKTSKMGQRDIRRLLIVGAMALVRAATRRGAAPSAWLAQMLARKPRMLVAIALANKMARGLWAMMVKQEVYRDPAAVAT